MPLWRGGLFFCASGSHAGHDLGGQMKTLYRGLLLTLAFASPMPAVAGTQCQAPGPGQPIELSGCQAGDRLVLHGLNFETASAQLSPGSTRMLEQVAAALRASPGILVNIHGHTDNVGDADYNRELSQFRAEAVKQFLVDLGVSAQRMQARGFGKSDPLADNVTAAGRAQNRRVELVLAGTGAPVRAAAAPPPPPKTVYMTTFSAQPSQLTVPLGTTVTWKNYDEITHSVVVANEKSQRLWSAGWKGQTFSKTFDKPGEYPFQCGVHNDVHGKIIVVAGPVAESSDPKPTYTGHTLSGMPSKLTTAAPMHQHEPQAHSVHAAPAPAPTAGSPAEVAGDAVLIRNHAFSPASLAVPLGGQVTWRNQDGGSHTVVFADMVSERMSSGDSYSRSFDTPGVYEYRCGIHGSMRGRISVGQI